MGVLSLVDLKWDFSGVDICGAILQGRCVEMEILFSFLLFA